MVGEDGGVCDAASDRGSFYPLSVDYFMCKLDKRLRMHVM